MAPMVWAPVLYGAIAGGVYSWGVGDDRPKQIVNLAAWGATGGAVIAFLIMTTRAERAKAATGELGRRLDAEHSNKRPYRGWTSYAP